MIYTLTLNPCVDRTLTVKGFEIGKTNRADKSEKRICGKGINTSVALKNLGYSSTAIFFNYKNGENAYDTLSSLGISCKCVDVEGEIRTNIKIHDTEHGVMTEVNSKGEPVDESSVEKMSDLIISLLQKGDVITLSGSVPPGVKSDFYKKIIEKAKEKGAKTILDAEGELLSEGIKAAPDLIKPNKDEFEKLCKKTLKNKDGIISAAKELVLKGVGAVCVSMGKDGALYVSEKDTILAVNKLDKVLGTVGAGDSMVAGFALGLSESRSALEALKIASAIAAGSVSLPASDLCTKELFDIMLPKVQIYEEAAVSV